jgi:hypothetical protein
MEDLPMQSLRGTGWAAQLSLEVEDTRLLVFEGDDNSKDAWLDAANRRRGAGRLRWRSATELAGPLPRSAANHADVVALGARRGSGGA